MHQTLFTARLTEDVPPRLAVVFTPGSGFKKDGMDCGTLIPKAGRHIKISLADRTVMNEAAGDLASACNRGTFLAFRQVSQHNYAYEDDNEEGEIGTIAQVVLQVRNASLVAEFARSEGAATVAPIMPGAGIVEEVVNVQPLVGIQAVAGASQDRLTGSLTDLTPVEFDLYARCFKYPEFSNMALYQAFLEKERALKESLEAIPAEVAMPDTSSQDKLTGSLTGLQYVEWTIYANCLKQADLRYTAQYQAFLEKERALKKSLEASPAGVFQKEKAALELEEKLKAAAAHDTLTFIIPQNEIFDFIARCQEAPFLYPVWREMSLNGQLKHDELKKTNPHYHRALQAERDYLAKQARNQ